MISPIPTMMRKAKNGISTGGRSCGANVASPISRAVQVPDMGGGASATVIAADAAAGSDDVGDEPPGRPY